MTSISLNGRQSRQLANVIATTSDEKTVSVFSYADHILVLIEDAQYNTMFSQKIYENGTTETIEPS